MIAPAFFALLSHWRQHRFQLAALVIGLALATALWMAVQAINTQAKASYAEAEGYLQRFDQDALTAPQDNLTVTDYVGLKRSGWPLSPVLEGRIRLGGHYIDIIGIDLLSAPPVTSTSPLSSESDQGAFLISLLRAPGGLILHPQSAAPLSELTEVEIHASTDVPPGLAIGDIATVSRLLAEPHRLTRLIYLAPNAPSARALAVLPSHITFTPGNSSRIAPGTLTQSFHLNLTAFGFLSFVVGLFIVQGTIGLAMEQRRGLFRTLRCLGVPIRHLILLLLIETVALAFAAAAIGLILGYSIAAALLPGVAVTLSGLYGVEIDNGLALRSSWILSGFAMTLLGASIASAFAFYSLWKLPILQAASTQARGQRILKNFATWAQVAAFILVTGCIAYLVLSGLAGGFVLLGSVMLSAALLLPLCLWHLLLAGQRKASSPLAQWLWSDARAQLPGLSLSLMALMLALATNIGVGTMVSSFRLTFDGWLDQRLSSELYVTARDDAQGTQLQQWLEEKGIRVLPIRFDVLQQRSGQITIYGVRDDTTYRDNWPMLDALPRAWDRLSDGQGILISEQLARRQGLEAGDTIALPPGWPNKILGIYADYGNPHGQAIVSMAALLRNAPDAPNQRFGLRLDASETPALIKEIQEEFDLERENITEQEKIKAASRRIFNQTFRVTDSLKLLTLGVASFAMFISLVTLWSQRLPQLGPVWAMGVSRKTLALIDILRSLLMAGLTALLALPLGLFLSWTLLVVINTEAFGWRLPLYLFPLDWLWLVLLSLLAALLAALLPAWRLFHLHPSELLKVFSSER